ncbi:MAG: hypothetical protein U1D69_12775, partial [Polynucleobacter sp.]|nr:hypothetical protein [Polynucleobacter sp.]
MRQFNAQPFYIAASRLKDIHAALDRNAGARSRPISAELNAEILTHVRNLKKALVSIDAKVTLASLQKINGPLLKKTATNKMVGDIINDVDGRLKDELKYAYFYTIDNVEFSYYYPTAPLFGEAVHKNFPKAAPEIAESGRCFAVGRYTASVFHLMRATEPALDALSLRLKVDDIKNNPSWGSILAAIQSRINEMPKGSEKDFFQGIWRSIDGIKNVWRNRTMHFDKTFNREEAEAV